MKQTWSPHSNAISHLVVVRTAPTQTSSSALPTLVQQGTEVDGYPSAYRSVPDECGNRTPVRRGPQAWRDALRSGYREHPSPSESTPVGRLDERRKALDRGQQFGRFDRLDDVRLVSSAECTCSIVRS